jgi:IS5 family transposase
MNDPTPRYEPRRKLTRRDVFLQRMHGLVPWSELISLVEPHYPKRGRGRPPVGVERMLRIHLVQHWFKLADAACEEALHDSAALRAFVGLNQSRERVPDATTILKFRHLLLQHDLTRPIFDAVSRVLRERGLRLSLGAIVDAAVVAAPAASQPHPSERRSRTSAAAMGGDAGTYAAGVSSRAIA